MSKRRRGAGEGSIYQRADGSWCAMIDLGIVNGKRKRKFVYGKTRRRLPKSSSSCSSSSSKG
jgi:integrase